MLTRILLTILGLLFATSSVSAALVEQFQRNYDALPRQVNDRSGEIAAIDSFTYQKDVAVFNFGPGTMLLQRTVNGRPTVAAFVGKGHVHVDIPVGVERQAYYAQAHDTVVDEDFSVCFMRIGDDFDLAVKSRFTFSQGQMAVAQYEKLRDAQPEFYFKPNTYHFFDNLAELLISVYERRQDGYFWASFNHTMFCFDPNSSEQVSISHSREPKTAPPVAVWFQRKERNRYAEYQLAELAYPTQTKSLDATLQMGGSDGWRIEGAEIQTTVWILRDSLRFVTIFLDPQMDPDSIYCNGLPVEHFRRKDFYQYLLLLPEYAHRGDSLAVHMWFGKVGDDYHTMLPWVENRNPVVRSLSLVYPKGYNYVLPGSSHPEPCGGKRFQCTASAFMGQNFSFAPAVTGYDTSYADVDSLLHLIYVAHSNDNYHYVDQSDFKAEVAAAFSFFLKKYGLPSQMDSLYIFPFGSASNPGMLHIPARKSDTAYGGLALTIASHVASQWFGPTIQLASYRESWMSGAIPIYLSLMYTEQRVGPSTMYTNLKQWQLEIERVVEKEQDVPLAAGLRGDAQKAYAKGVWMLHMLRMLMRDLEGLNDNRFTAFLKDVVERANQGPFSNADFCRLAAQHAGFELDWFFAQWMYGRDFPDFAVAYNVSDTAGQYFVNLNVKTAGTPTDRIFPVLLRINLPQGSALVRRAISGQEDLYQIGPLDAKPLGIVFNEYESVLCHKKVK